MNAILHEPHDNQWPTMRSLNIECHRCGKKHLDSFVWLELDSHTGVFHEPGTVAPERSQGLFRFGRKCAAKANVRRAR